MTARDALARLKEGNARYVDGSSRILEIVGARQRLETLPAQHPFAAVVSCSDSRVPVEVVFDHGLGELFVIRVAGNLVGTLEAASVEYAVGSLGVSLIVIMGHTGCGAVEASLSELGGEGCGAEETQVCIQELVTRLSESLAPRLLHSETIDHAELLATAIRENIQISIDDLRRQSPYLAELDADGTIAIVGAEYNIESGVVEFLSDRAR